MVARVTKEDFLEEVGLEPGPGKEDRVCRSRSGRVWGG